MISYVFITWNIDELDWMLSSQVFMFQNWLSKDPKDLRLKEIHVRCLNWLYPYQSSSYKYLWGEESLFLFHLFTCQSAVFSKSYGKIDMAFRISVALDYGGSWSHFRDVFWERSQAFSVLLLMQRQALLQSPQGAFLPFHTMEKSTMVTVVACWK